MFINHNINAMNTYNRLNVAEKSKSSAMEKLSSGMRINRASDDAAGATISEKMKAQIRGLEQAGRNIQDGVSLVQTAEAGLGSIFNPNLQRMREIMLQALNGTLTQQERTHIQNELENVKANIDEIANDTEFNNIKVLSPPIISKEEPPNQLSTKLDIVFMIDNSGSMKSNIDTVKAGVEDFVNNLEGTADAKVAIVNLCAGSPYDVRDFEGDSSKIKNNLNGLSGVDGTKPYEIIQQAIPGGNIGNKLSYRQDSKKIFVVFTDTRDEANVPGITEETAKKAVEGSNISAGFDSDDIQTYFFGMGGGFPDDAFDDIVNFTGGKIYHPITTQDISDKLKNDLTKDINDSVKPSEPVITEEEMPKIPLQVGANSGEEFQVELFDARTKKLGIDDVKIDPIEEAEKSLDKIDKAMKLVSSQRSKFGAYQNALEHIAKNVDNYGYNISAAQSRISDADMAKEVMEMTKSGIIEQSAQAMLQQAQKMPESVMRLMDKWKGNAEA